HGRRERIVEAHGRGETVRRPEAMERADGGGTEEAVSAADTAQTTMCQGIRLEEARVPAGCLIYHARRRDSYLRGKGLGLVATGSDGERRLQAALAAARKALEGGKTGPSFFSQMMLGASSCPGRVGRRTDLHRLWPRLPCGCAPTRPAS